MDFLNLAQEDMFMGVKTDLLNGDIGNDLMLAIIRGLPGSGKSTIAKRLYGHNHQTVILETDMYWYRNADRKYEFEFEHLNRAHRWCLQTAEAFLAQDRNVVIANTNLTFSEVKHYVDFAKRLGAHIFVHTLSKDINHGSIHGVPPEVMERMYNKIEEHELFMEKVRAHQPG
jgi:predicted kinase